MGMGEPLANYDNVCRAMPCLTRQRDGSGFSSGYTFDFRLVPQIRRIAEENLQFQLAISLHAG